MAPDPVRTGGRTHPLLIRVVTTLTAWLVAFLIVFALLVLFGAKLESLPLALNALVFTGILVPIMGNLVMPTLSVAVANAVGRMGAGERAQEAASARTTRRPAQMARTDDRHSGRRSNIRDPDFRCGTRR